MIVGAVALSSAGALAFGVTSGADARMGLTASPRSGGGPAAGLSGVSCTSSRACEAVGHYENSSRVLEPLAEVWNGAKWKVQAVPHPSGSTGAALAEVSCTSAHACEAVGSYTDSSGVNVTLAEVWNGTKWALQATPNPAHSAYTSLTGVSCTSAHVCEAVGFSTNKSGSHKTLAESWNGAKWAVQSTPNPSGSIGSTLGAVSCTGAGACEAVGFYAKTAGLYKTLAQAWTGSKWVVQASPNPSGSLTSSLIGVGCASGHSCEAVGFYLSNSGSRAFAERWTGTKWAVRSIPSPAGGTAIILEGVSCARAAVCETVGSYQSNSGSRAFAEKWNGTKWVAQATPSPAGASGLSDVSCVSVDACAAVGLDSARSGTLVDRWNGTKWALQASPTP